MATCNQRVIFILSVVLISLTSIKSQKLKSKRDLYNYGNLNDIDHEALKALFGEDGYFSDTRQDRVDPSILGGIRLQVEASKLSAKLRWISNEELGITHMQVSKCCVNIYIQMIRRIFLYHTMVLKLFNFNNYYVTLSIL
jgi:hypothetical protein